MRQALGLAAAAVGVALLWGAVTGQSVRDEFLAAIGAGPSAPGKGVGTGAGVGGGSSSGRTPSGPTPPTSTIGGVQPSIVPRFPR